MPVHEALNLFKRENLRRAPVIKNEKLVGIVSDRDLLNASPSPVTSLSVWELNYLLSKVTISDVMTREVVSVVAAAMLAVAVATMATPAFAKKPADSNETTFTIKTNLEGSWGFWGTFRADGAIEDSGYASYDVWDYDVLDINGEYGSMLIQTFITHFEENRAYGTFWIFDADGAYEGLIDVMGAYSQKLTMPKPKPMYPEERPKWHLSQMLEGALPQE